MAITKRHKRVILKVMLIVAFSIAYNSIRFRTKLTKTAISRPSESPWRHLYLNGDDSSFLLLTGLSRNAFRELLSLLFPYYLTDTTTRRVVGRPQLLSPDAQLGLFLFYIGSTMSLKHLCLIFGITPSTCSRIINKMLQIVIEVLRTNEKAKVQFPDEDKMNEFARLINQREPSIHDVIGFMDGLSLHSECTSEEIAQNANYSGYHCDTMINNVFAFGPDGKIFLAAINYPGSWHDSSLIARLLPKITRKCKGRKICVDQGFPRGGMARDVLVGPYSKKSAAKLSPILRTFLLRRSSVYTSLRQASEWGMRALQGSFPRLKKRLPADEKIRSLVIEAIVLVHNFRTHVVGLNQIQTVFNPEYEKSISIDNYDRIARYYIVDDHDD